jgi:DNA-binding NarL/FixJ family response regulator
MSPEPIRVLIVDDHRMFADALELLLRDEEDIEMLGTVTTGEEAVAVAGTRHPSVFLMDVELPGIDGIEATRFIRAVDPSARVVMVTAHQQPELIAKAIDAGASGYLPKTHAADRVVDAVRRAAAGELLLPTGALQNVLRTLGAGRAERQVADPAGDQLTGREIEVLQAIADGATTDEVAGRLFVAVSTVQTHVKNILTKLGVHSKLEAVTFALRRGLIRLRRDDGAA